MKLAGIHLDDKPGFQEHEAQANTSRCNATKAMKADIRRDQASEHCMEMKWAIQACNQQSSRIRERALHVQWAHNGTLQEPEWRYEQMDGKGLLDVSLICGSLVIAGSAMAVTMEDPWMYCRTIDMASKNVYYSLPFKISNKELSVPSVQYANEFYEHLRKEKRNPSRIYSNCFRTTLIRAELDMGETMENDKRLYNVVRTSWKK